MSAPANTERGRRRRSAAVARTRAVRRKPIEQQLLALLERSFARHRVPWEAIEEIGVIDAASKRRVEEILSRTSGTSRTPRVTVRPGWYCDERQP